MRNARIDRPRIELGRDTVALLEQVTSDGFAVIPEALAQAETVTLLEALERSDLPRSRAGIRHGMACPCRWNGAGPTAPWNRPTNSGF